MSRNRSNLGYVASAALGMAAALTGCGGSSGEPSPATAKKLSCQEFASLEIPPSAIIMPTNGGKVTDAQVVSASAATGEHCLISGSLKPVDPAAPEIRFRVAMPASWNGKTAMLGGAGFNGSVPDVAGNLLNMPQSAPTPLARGYAVFASDSGHQTSQTSHPAAFALNDEALRNWMGDALKKTRDAAMFLIQARYGSPPSRSYFFGSSTGGREALTVAARWPADWHGVVSLYPARDVATQGLGMVAAARAMAAPGAYPSRAKRGLLYAAALAACDALDGVADGVISDEKSCAAAFDPATAVVGGVPLRCASGVDAGDGCLSDAQIQALKEVNSTVVFNTPLASGDNSFPGWNVLTSDTGIPKASPVQELVNALALGSVAPAFPATPAMALTTGFADGVRFFAGLDPASNYLDIDPSNPAALGARFGEVSLLDAKDLEMSGFAQKGGKILLMHGSQDLLVSPRITQRYFERLQAKLGIHTVDGFARFYLIPGFGHSVSSTFNAAWDSISALENWVEQGRDPMTGEVVTDTLGVPGRTRPLCLYPQFPRYKGSGDINVAASFVCAAS